MKNRRRTAGNKGFSLVEVVSIIAILSIVIVAIGSIMVYTTKTYKKGNEETQVQQEAQFAANRIDGMIQNSTTVSYDNAAKVLKMNDGTSEHVISYVAAASPTTSGQLYYEKDATGVKHLLAENIEAFDVNLDDFDDSRIVKLGMLVKDNDKEFKMEYNMKARNESGAATVFTSADILVTNRVILIPGQTNYSIDVEVKGSSLGFTATSSDPSKLTIESVTSDKVIISVDKDAVGDTFGDMFITLSTVETDPANPTVPLKSKQVRVGVRRVKTINISHKAPDLPDPAATPNSVGTKYTFKSSSIVGTYLDEHTGAIWDNGINAYSVSWTPKLEIGGSTAAFSSYFSVDGTTDNKNIQDVTYKIIQEVPTDAKLIVTAKSKHASGTNKISSNYATVTDMDMVDFALPAPPAPPAPVDPTPTDTTVVMEPNLEKSFTLPMVGDDIKCDLYDKTSGSTKATYSGDQIKIKLGQSEEGNAAGIFNVKVHQDGDSVNVSTVEVKVRRVKEVEFTSDSEKNLKNNNKENGVVILEASVDGTNLAKEAVNDDDYVNPYLITWSVITKDGAEKKLNDYTDFIKKVTVTDNETGNQSVKIELKKALPAGTKIKATSKHAAGANKSAAFYEDIYAELTVKGESSGGGIKKTSAAFQRGATNYDLVENLCDDDPDGDGPRKSILTEGYQLGYQTAAYFYRYREEGGTWSQYLRFMCKPGDGNGNLMMEGYTDGTTGMQGQSNVFRPDKAYDIEVMYIIYDTNTKEIFWPWNDVVLTPGYGFKEYGFKFSDDSNNRRAVEGEAENCVVQIHIPKAEIYWVKNAALGQSEESTHFFAQNYKETSPIKVKRGSGESDKKVFNIDADYIALTYPEDHVIHYKTVIQKKDSSGKWKDVTSEVYNNNVHSFSMNGLKNHQTNIFYYEVNYVWWAEGLYRFGICLEDWPCYNININGMISPETTLNDMFNSGKHLNITYEDLNFFDWGTGYNVVYYTFYD